MTDEAPLEQTHGGTAPAGDGWFVVNTADAPWLRHDYFGATSDFEGATRFPETGIGLHVLWPGQPNGMYHAETAQEDFLVVAGECLLLIEGGERPLRAWDFVHCPSGTEHIFVGAGTSPCVIVMVGARPEGRTIRYPVSELARRHGASVEEETDTGRKAYARFPQWESGPMPEGALPSLGTEP